MWNRLWFHGLSQMLIYISSNCWKIYLVLSKPKLGPILSFFIKNFINVGRYYKVPSLLLKNLLNVMNQQKSFPGNFFSRHIFRRNSWGMKTILVKKKKLLLFAYFFTHFTSFSIFQLSKNVTGALMEHIFKGIALLINSNEKR